MLRMGVALCGFIAGCEGWVDVELFGLAKEKWFEKFLELPNGIPSHDTFGRVFALLDPQQLARVLRQFVQAVLGSLEGESIAIDGKTLRRSGEDTTGKAALHLVSAWATERGSTSRTRPPVTLGAGSRIMFGWLSIGRRLRPTQSFWCWRG